MKSLFDKAVDAIMNDGIFLTESTKTHLWTIMHGLKPSVSSIGIVTAENPMGVERPAIENKQLNIVLEKYLREKNYSFNHISGKYGNIENPYMIRNINRDEIIAIGKKFEQESVIWGNTSSPDNLKFELIYCFSDQVLEARVFRNQKMFSQEAYLSRILHGMDSTVKTIGIIPHANKSFPEKELKNYISSLRNGAFHIVEYEHGGKVDYFIFNIPEKEFLEYTKRFNPVLWGNVDNWHNIVYHYYLDGKKYSQQFPNVYGEEMTVFYRDSVKSRFEIPLFDIPLEQEVDNYYSIYKGRKFIIPFYDNKYNTKKFVKNPEIPIGAGGTGIGEWEIAETMDMIIENTIKGLDPKYVGYKFRGSVYGYRRKLNEKYGVIR